MRGERIYNLAQLDDLRLQKRAVICKARCFRRHMPAAFAINLAGAVLLRLFRRGMYVYEKGDSNA